MTTKFLVQLGSVIRFHKAVVYEAYLAVSYEDSIIAVSLVQKGIRKNFSFSGLPRVGHASYTYTDAAGNRNRRSSKPERPARACGR